MASIQCPGCKAHITVPGLINCPRCQTFMDPPFLREAKKATSSPSNSSAAPSRPAAYAAASPVIAPAKYKMTGMDWFATITISAIVVLAVLIVYRMVVPSEIQQHDRKVSAALFACQQRISGLADYGGTEMPPYSKNWAKGDEFYFAWPRGSFHSRNGFGAKMPMSASCNGIVSTSEIQHLTVNGKDIFVGTPNP